MKRGPPVLPVYRVRSETPGLKAQASRVLLARRDAPVLRACKVWPEARAPKVRRWSVLPDPLAVPVLLARKAQPAIRAHKATLKWEALLALPAVVAISARKVRWVRPVPRALWV